MPPSDLCEIWWAPGDNLGGGEGGVNTLRAIIIQPLTESGSRVFRA